MPMASTIAKSVSVLIEKSKMKRPANVPMSEIGTATTAITIARQLCRKMNTTRITRMAASTKVLTTSSIDAVMNLVVSNGIEYVTPSGNEAFIPSSLPFTAFATSSALAPVARKMPTGTPGRSPRKLTTS